MTADTTTSSVSKHRCYEPHQMDQILSLLDDQSSCLTIKTIMLELSVPRFVARRLLGDVARRVTCSGHAGGGMTYEVVRMVPKTEVDELGRRKVSMELVVTNTAAATAHNGDDEEELGAIFSIAPAAPPSEDGQECTDDDVQNCISIVSAAHEKAMADQRDKLIEGSESELFSIFDVLGGGLLLEQCNIDDGEYILPAPELCEEDGDGKRVIIRRVKRGRNAPTLSNGSGANGLTSNGGSGPKSRIGSKATVTSSTNSTVVATKSNVTTAAAFFGSSNNKSSNGVNNKKTFATSRSEDISTAKLSKDNKTQENEDPSIKDEIMDKRATDNDAESSAKGNADDFIGDTDEDEDFLQEEAARKKRNAAAARKAAREQMQNDQFKRRNLGTVKARRSCKDPEKRRKILDDESVEEKQRSDEEIKDLDQEDEEKDEKVGAMDAFAKKGSDSSSAEKGTKKKSDNDSNRSSKKRIKKLVEQTSVDKNGYMRTEMVTVWEEVDDTKEEESRSTGGTAESKKNDGMVKSGSGRASSSAAKKGGAKKQTGLMGFFAKKK
ncbi:hypothetical protein ACHAXS_005023 [Conticribra weissflogii]